MHLSPTSKLGYLSFNFHPCMLLKLASHGPMDREIGGSDEKSASVRTCVG